jgi:hypothetical protein
VVEVQLIDSSRSLGSHLGGFGVPIAVAATLDEGLLDRNARFHAEDARWRRAEEDQARASAERAGRRALLPLLTPVVDLERGPDVPPSELLRPRRAVVPFVPRGDLLDQVMRCRETDDPGHRAEPRPGRRRPRRRPPGTPRGGVGPPREPARRDRAAHGGVRAEVLARDADERLAGLLEQWADDADPAVFLAAQANELLTERAEARLVAALPTEPRLLPHLGVLGLARAIGIEAAYGALSDATLSPKRPAERLALARITAGSDPSAEAQFTHALAAQAAGNTAEAAWAMGRCRDACATWERASFGRRLDEAAAARPDLDWEPLRADP